jgi:hypothetical protein
MSITQHHLKEAGTVTADIHLYCGRGKIHGKGLINIDMGNPYRILNNSDEERNRVCDLYRKWLESKPRNSREFRIIERIAQRLREGKSIALYCYCVPQRCHIDIIKEMAEYLSLQKGDTL